MSIPSVNQDDEHLRLLAIFHYVYGGLMCLGGCFPLIYTAIGVFFVVAPEALSNGHPAEAPPAVIGWVFVAFGVVLFLILQALGICTIVAGRRLTQRRGYIFIFVDACVLCIMLPFGTALGVCTILVLSRPSVKGLFGQLAAPRRSLHHEMPSPHGAW